MHDSCGNIMIVKNKKMYIPKNYNKQNSLLVYSLEAWENASDKKRLCRF